MGLKEIQTESEQPLHLEIAMSVFDGRRRRNDVTKTKDLRVSNEFPEPLHKDAAMLMSAPAAPEHSRPVLITSSILDRSALTDVKMEAQIGGTEYHAMRAKIESVERD